MALLGGSREGRVEAIITLLKLVPIVQAEHRRPGGLLPLLLSMLWLPRMLLLFGVRVSAMHQGCPLCGVPLGRSMLDTACGGESCRPAVAITLLTLLLTLLLALLLKYLLIVLLRIYGGADRRCCLLWPACCCCGGNGGRHPQSACLPPKEGRARVKAAGGHPRCQAQATAAANSMSRRCRAARCLRGRLRTGLGLGGSGCGASPQGVHAPLGL